MAVLQYRTLSNRTVAALSVEHDTVFWDRELQGSDLSDRRLAKKLLGNDPRAQRGA